MTQEITKITVNNFKGVRGSVDIEPDGKRLLVVAGPNGAGKSSFLGAVSEIFDPKSAGWADRLTERADAHRDQIEHEVCS